MKSFNKPVKWAFTCLTAEDAEAQRGQVTGSGPQQPASGEAQVCLALQSVPSHRMSWDSLAKETSRQLILCGQSTASKSGIANCYCLSAVAPLSVWDDA